jgi:hypothetical protein
MTATLLTPERMAEIRERLRRSREDVHWTRHSLGDDDRRELLGHIEALDAKVSVCEAVCRAVTESERRAGRDVDSLLAEFDGKLTIADQLMAAESRLAALEAWEDTDDEWTEAIHAAHPSRNDANHEHYATAMQMVGRRHGKHELVALVCWLLALAEGRKRQAREALDMGLESESRLAACVKAMRETRGYLATFDHQSANRWRDALDAAIRAAEASEGGSDGSL